MPVELPIIWTNKVEVFSLKKHIFPFLRLGNIIFSEITGSCNYARIFYVYFYLVHCISNNSTHIYYRCFINPLWQRFNVISHNFRWNFLPVVSYACLKLTKCSKLPSATVNSFRHDSPAVFFYRIQVRLRAGHIIPGCF